LAGAAIIAAQPAILVRGIVRFGGLMAGRGIFLVHAGMPFMTVLQIRMHGNRAREVRHRRSMLAKWHRHRTIALQRQPKRNENNNPAFPAISHFRIIGKSRERKQS